MNVVFAGLPAYGHLFPLLPLALACAEAGQADILPRMDLVVHHGGAGTMLGAVAHGLPQLILPQGADQPFNAAAIERTGAGRALPNEAQVPGTIGAAVGVLLAEGPERLAAKRLAAELDALPSPAEVAASLG